MGAGSWQVVLPPYLQKPNETQHLEVPFVLLSPRRRAKRGNVL